MKTKILMYKVQIMVLLIGTIFAFYTVYVDFRDFYEIEGALLKFKDCQVTNPLLTACFYGAFGFLATLIWSIYIDRIEELKRKFYHHKRLLILVIGCTIFAWTNFSIVLFKYLDDQADFGCSIKPIKTPWESACFIGSVIFLVGLVFVVVNYRILAKSQKDTVIE